MKIIRGQHLERNPQQANFACPKTGGAADAGNAPKPLSACRDCPYMSFSSCTAQGAGAHQA